MTRGLLDRIRVHRPDRVLQQQRRGERISHDHSRRDYLIVEVDQLLRSRVASHAARLFLESIAAGEHAVVNVSPGLLRRAVELDSAFADLELGYLDAAVMAIAERDRLAVLTFDFEPFRATRPDHGFWQLVIDEHRYQTHTRS